MGRFYQIKSNFFSGPVIPCQEEEYPFGIAQFLTKPVDGAVNGIIDRAYRCGGQFSDLFITQVFKKPLLDEEIEDLIAERSQARKDRNFARADEIRDLLKARR